jgi:uncharacterized membrane protein
MTALILGLGLVVDGGYAWSQRRVAQNAADLSSLAGTRVVAMFQSGAAVNGTDVIATMNQINQANGVPNIAAGDALYVD